MIDNNLTGDKNDYLDGWPADAVYYSSI